LILRHKRLAYKTENPDLDMSAAYLWKKYLLYSFFSAFNFFKDVGRFYNEIPFQTTVIYLIKLDVEGQ